MGLGVGVRGWVRVRVGVRGRVRGRVAQPKPKLHLSPLCLDLEL